MMIRVLVFVLATLLLPWTGASPLLGQAPEVAEAVRIERISEPEGWKVFDGDQLVAGYRVNMNGIPIIYPVMGPKGQSMTRDFPMTEPGKFEKSDHDHHRSLWFSHGEVNGIDFWADGEGCGVIVPTKGEATVDKKGGAIILTENDWNSPDGKRVLSDVRRFAFFEDEGRRVIDVDVLLRATDGDVTFGDTKEGVFGIRVPGSMNTEANQGGEIINAQGDTGVDAWGKPAPWVDYSGPVYTDDGMSNVAGITIHDCPSSFGYPTRWQVRTYGLFAANPFGISPFEGGEKRSGIVLQEGKTLRLNYRVMLHNGGLDPDVAKSDSEKFANDPRPELTSDR